ncbi:hypothetical protein A0H81_13311 [Grifola frondosa]|uniref:SHSP domain-containing protein n=1 Tax=Grifola frondosa TaxID=5627 RepID=A0A1C7LQE4_GRIFR|nr:hypothetical protein A0H81_13311 [Grifola frondosa]
MTVMPSHTHITALSKVLGRELTLGDVDRIRIYMAYLKSRRQLTKIYKPRMDLYDEPSNPRIAAVLELPGMKAEELSICVSNGHIVVHGERHGPLSRGQSIETRSDGEIRDISSPALQNRPVRELKYGRFRRALTLPPGSNASHVQASLANGMLTLVASFTDCFGR